MVAAIGNTYGMKLKDAEIRQLAYKKYCEHLALGKSQRSFTFEHPVQDENGKIRMFSCHWQTIESYIKDQQEFDPLQKQIAISKGHYKWEQIVEDSATGLNEKANTASLQMKMRNAFGWDKHDKSEENSPKEFDHTLEIVKPTAKS